MGSTPGKETIVFGDGGLQSGFRKWGFAADPEVLKTHSCAENFPSQEAHSTKPLMVPSLETVPI